VTTAITKQPKQTSIAMLERVRSQLSAATNIDDVKDVIDKAEAVKAYCRKAKLGGDVANQAAAVKLQAERRAGEMLAEMPLKGGDRKSQSHDARVKLSDFGIEATQSHRWQLIASLPFDIFQSHIDECLESDRELTTSAVLKLAKKSKATTIDEPSPEQTIAGVFTTLEDIAATGEKFKTIYADPPWRYGNQATRASTDNHYPTMAVEDIAAMPVAPLVDDAALLFLWTTNGFLFESKAVIDAWGFEFKSALVWVKPQMGIGNYVRNAHEYLLIASRGGMRTSAPGRSMKSWIEHDRGKHSSKPGIFRQTVEQLSEPNRLELFGREAVPGWVVFGNQVSKGLL
jgi:N6-adenosine-specific RNA methylase IME4